MGCKDLQNCYYMLVVSTLVCALKICVYFVYVLYILRNVLMVLSTVGLSAHKRDTHLI